MLIGALGRRPRGDPVGRASGFGCYMGGGGGRDPTHASASFHAVAVLIADLDAFGL